MTGIRSAFIGVLVAATAAQVSADVVIGRASTADIHDRVLVLVNKARAAGRRCGGERFQPTTSLAASAVLDRAARVHATDMARKNYFEHTGKDGSSPKDRLTRLGYHSRLTGENIAYGPTSAEEVVSGWLESPGHCANIMDPRFREMGIAFAVERRHKRIYWVQDLALPRN